MKSWNDWLDIVAEVTAGGEFTDISQMIVQEDDRPYLDISIYGASMRGLLDSGSTRSLMNEEHWNKLAGLGLKLKDEKFSRIRLATGMTSRVIGSVNLPVNLKGKVKLIHFLVVPKLSSSLILGMDFWRKMRVVPNFIKEFDLNEVTAGVDFTTLMGQSALSEKEKQDLEKLTDKWKNTKPDKLGCTSAVEHRIDTGDNEPIKQRYYPVSPYIQGILDVELKKMLDEEIIEPSNSPWSSPVVLVKKQDGTYRFCVDYRQVNAVTKRDAYPLPYVSHILDRLRDAKYISSIDIKSAYWQIPVEKSSREKTAFTVPNRGLFQFKRMPFGLHNSPATWQRLIDKVLGPDLEPYVLVYLDDIIIIARSFEEHLKILEEVLRRLAAANLTINWEKCQFCRQELKFLGYVVNQYGLRVDPAKIEAIVDYPAPKNVKQVRQFIGLASWYRRFVPQFSSLISPLTELLKKRNSWQWGPAQERTFSLIKDKLVSAPILTCPDFERPFFLQTDASLNGLGAILYQTFPEGDKAIAYASRSTTSAEKKYTTTELECLAVLWAMDKFRPYLEGMSFTVLTDHMALKWLNTLKEPKGRLARWALKLQQYDFQIQHRPGKQNAAADALSRQYETAVIDAIDVKGAEPWYVKMIEDVTNSPEKFPRWIVKNNKLFKHVYDKRKIVGDDNSWKLVIPKADRKRILHECHDDPMAGHMGIFKTLQRLREQYYWPGMPSDAARYVSRCHTCLAYKPLQRAPGGLMGKQRHVSRPWQMISVDLMGPLPMTSNRNRFILSFCDYFSKYCILIPLKNATAKNVVTALEKEVLLTFGSPDIIICDNGPQFKCHELKTLAEEFNIKLWYTPHYHPQANPMERPNRVIKTLLATFVKDDHQKWDVDIFKKQFAINSAVHEVTGYSPAYLNFGRELRRRGNMPIEDDYGSEVPIIENRQDCSKKRQDMSALYQIVQERLTQAYERSSKTYNLRRRPVEFKVGDTVWRRTQYLSDAGNRFNRKLAPKYVKCTVTKRLGSQTYNLQDEEGKDVGNWHVQDLKAHPAD